MSGAIDQVTAEVIRSAMETVCFEMATFVSRHRNANCVEARATSERERFLDGHGRLAADESAGIPGIHVVDDSPARFGESSSSATS